MGALLERLAETLDFQLHLMGRGDTVVDDDISNQAPQLLAKLSPTNNLIVTHARDPR